MATSILRPSFPRILKSTTFRQSLRPCISPAFRFPPQPSTIASSIPSLRHNSVNAPGSKPWHSSNLDEPPVPKVEPAHKEPPSELEKSKRLDLHVSSKLEPGKGKLVPTPSHLLKLLLPLPPLLSVPDSAGDKHLREGRSSEIEEPAPLSFILHPRQPLSYLERLIQAELPLIERQKTRDSSNNDTVEKPPNIYFKVRETDSEFLEHAGLAEEAKKAKGRLVRWSSSTEIGDFVRDAARSEEFILEIGTGESRREGKIVGIRRGRDGEIEEEGMEEGVRRIVVTVPSFYDRTRYMRRRLSRITTEIDALAAIKKECDALAHRGAQRLALSGFGILVCWWGAVFKFSFFSELGWDVMEPVTYLVGLTTVISGYLWFLYHNREVSYRSMLNITITRRQAKLYEEKGFDVEMWEELVQEGKELRNEIRKIAKEYDVDWKEGKKEAVNKELWDDDERKRSKKVEEKIGEEEEDEHK
ncbi:DUF607-domain-containing protein [Ascobolus immersus RN42]|uniref:Calcium uniporter protein n=1 Tax=Ascobolus immersus RN42 TaxID=1160509 RepID=A0A3N4IB43_ASCIM|nr:DUF607-domain-containing protein [Ascobolus immersus RN42]